MSARSAVVCLLALLGANPANAHRLDEYLQATTIAVEPGRVEAEIRLVPGVDVFPIVFADIDRDADGVASAAEQRAYTERVLGDLSLTVDRKRIPLRIISSTFAPKELLQAGRGQIQLRLEADVPIVAGERRLSFENRHQRAFGAYLANGLMPRNPHVELTAQRRSYDQSKYELDYTDGSSAAPTMAFGSWLQPWGWIDGALLILIVSLAWLGRRAGRDLPA